MKTGKPRRKRVQQFQIAHRRSVVSSYYLTGMYNAEMIAEKLQELHNVTVTPITVLQDIAFHEEQWRQQNGWQRKEWIAREVARLSELEKEAVEKLRQVRFVVTLPNGEEKTILHGIEGYTSATKDYIDSVLKIQQRRAKLLGLDAAEKFETKVDLNNVNKHTVTVLSTEELSKLIEAKRSLTEQASEPAAKEGAHASV